jgi:hypothetical protein
MAQQLIHHPRNGHRCREKGQKIRRNGLDFNLACDGIYIYIYISISVIGGPFR